MWKNTFYLIAMSLTGILLSQFTVLASREFLGPYATSFNLFVIASIAVSFIVIYIRNLQRRKSKYLVTSKDPDTLDEHDSQNRKSHKANREVRAMRVAKVLGLENREKDEVVMHQPESEAPRPAAKPKCYADY